MFASATNLGLHFLDPAFDWGSIDVLGSWKEAEMSIAEKGASVALSPWGLHCGSPRDSRHQASVLAICSPIVLSEQQPKKVPG
jgi:hypothetical protein